MEVQRLRRRGLEFRIRCNACRQIRARFLGLSSPAATMFVREGTTLGPVAMGHDVRREDRGSEGHKLGQNVAVARRLGRGEGSWPPMPRVGRVERDCSPQMWGRDFEDAAQGASPPCDWPH